MSSVAERLLSVAVSPPTPAVTGRWFNIRVCPDLALGELLNVGVGFVDSSSGETYVRVAHRLDRVRLLYGKEFEEELRRMLRVIENTGLQHTTESPFPNIRVSEQKFAAGTSFEEILGRLFDLTVPTFPSSEIEASRRCPDA